MSVKLMNQCWLPESGDQNAEEKISEAATAVEVVDKEQKEGLVDDEGMVERRTKEEKGRKVEETVIKQEIKEEELENLLAEAVIKEEIVEQISAEVVEESDVKEEVKVEKPLPIFDALLENEILCDENLIKEAKVIRCFCDPTREELEAGKGCGPGCINRELCCECGSRCPSGDKCANRRLKNREYAPVEIFDAGIKGYGLRALEPLEKGRFLIEYVGEVISAEQLKRRSIRYAKDPKHVHHYFMALKNGAAIDATMKGNISRFINHSCDPNCETQKWVVDRRLRVGFFVIRPIAVGEEIVFDYQFDRYGRKAQKCYCGAANCRGLIGEESEGESDGGESDVSPSPTLEDEENAEEDIVAAKEKQLKTGRKFVKEEKKKKLRKVRKKPARSKDYEVAVNKMVIKGPPRNHDQVLQFVHLLMQVEQASLRLRLLRCLLTSNQDIFRLFMENAGLRLMYLILAVGYPVDDRQAVLEMQVTALELLHVLPISTKNQVMDSHLNATVYNLIVTPGPIDVVVADTVQYLVNCIDDSPSTSTSPSTDSVESSDGAPDLVHLKLIKSAKCLLGKWQTLKEVFRIPRREQSHTPKEGDNKNRFCREDDKRVRGYFIERKPEVHDFSKRIVPIVNRFPRKRPFTPPNSQENSELLEAPHRRSRFDVVAMDVVTEEDEESQDGGFMDRVDYSVPPPPILLPESMFASGLPDFSMYSYDQDWGMYYNPYDPSSAMYPPCVPYQYPPPPQPVPPPGRKPMSILDAPSPPATPPPVKPAVVTNPNLRTLTVDMENPTDEQIALLKETLAAAEEKREQRRKIEEQSKAPPPPPPNGASKAVKWIRTTTDDGKIYFYNEETRETSWTLPPDAVEVTNPQIDRTETRATFKALICKHVAGLLEPIRKTRFASADDYKYVLRKLTHAVLDKELKHVGDDVDLRVTDSVRDKSRKYVSEYIARLGEGQYSRKNKQHNTY